MLERPKNEEDRNLFGRERGELLGLIFSSNLLQVNKIKALQNKSLAARKASAR